ncbi:MAG TPA: TonB family protein [Bacteroidales bacterium]|nr:TonB family protein [Bacteroidales bacterium]
MDTFIMYLLKSAAWLSGFAVVYMVFLRRERYFLLKRVYLITGMLVSFVLPLFTVHYPVEIPLPAAAPIIPGAADQFTTDQIAVTSTVQDQFNYYYLLAGIYVTGIVFLIAKNLYQFRNLLKAIKRSTISNLGTAKLIRTSEFTSSFSFFNYVFVNPSVSEDEVKEIMNHELVHVNQKHWCDLALGEFLRMLQWANPLAWIYTGFIRLNHEYLADEAALQCSSDPALYKAALLNQLFRSPVISLSNSFNYSITKTRFDMMKKIVTSPYRKLKVLMILPVFAIILYAFSVPEYQYIASEENQPVPFSINESSPIKADQEQLPAGNFSEPEDQQGVKGTVRDQDGKPIAGAHVVTTGATNPSATTDIEGKFSLTSVPNDASFLVMAAGYKSITVKAVYDKPMEIKLERDPDYKFIPQTTRSEPLVVIDGEVTDRKYSEVIKELGHNFGTMTPLQGKQATDKYGEKAANGAVEILTRTKAIEMGLNPPYPRIGPEDFPTFNGNNYNSITGWVRNKVTYPEEARSKGIEGWVVLNYTIQKDGSISIMPGGDASLQPLRDEIIKVLNSAPRFEPPKNPEANEPLNTSITVGFKLPDQVIQEEPYIVVESMPVYPGGDAALLQFIKDNTRYPEELKKDKIEGRVIVRFIVTPKGTAEGITVLKGVQPLMDAEAVRIVGSMKGWSPGMQGGRPVYVWYMCPVNFTAPVE